MRLHTLALCLLCFYFFQKSAMEDGPEPKRARYSAPQGPAAPKQPTRTGRNTCATLTPRSACGAPRRWRSSTGFSRASRRCGATLAAQAARGAPPCLRADGRRRDHRQLRDLSIHLVYSPRRCACTTRRSSRPARPDRAAAQRKRARRQAQARVPRWVDP